MINFTRKLSSHCHWQVPVLKVALPKTRTVLLRSCCPACLSHLLFVLRLAVAQSSASETVGSQPQCDGKANFSEVFQCLSVFEVPSEITHAENIRTQ